MPIAGFAGSNSERPQSAVFRSQGVMIGIEFGQHGTPVHRAGVSRQAERNSLAPAGLGDTFRCKWPASVGEFDGNTAACGDGGRTGCRLRQADLFIAVAREFGDAAECAEAPLRIGVGEMPVQQVDRWRGHLSASPPASGWEITVLSDRDKPGL
jgi:hypothetical protein